VEKSIGIREVAVAIACWHSSRGIINHVWQLSGKKTCYGSAFTSRNGTFVLLLVLNLYEARRPRQAAIPYFV